VHVALINTDGQWRAGKIGKLHDFSLVEPGAFPSLLYQHNPEDAASRHSRRRLVKGTLEGKDNRTIVIDQGLSNFRQDLCRGLLVIFDERNSGAALLRKSG